LKNKENFPDSIMFCDVGLSNTEGRHTGGQGIFTAAKDDRTCFPDASKDDGFELLKK
jgi:hypothetical protein